MTKIDIFSGFLGAGKTTLIKKLIAEAYSGEKLVLIENEFGEINIDGGFLKESGIEISEMSAGCICCSLVGDFNKALKEVVAQFHPDRILIEPSGVGKLSDVIVAVERTVDECPGELKLNSYVTVADASKVKVYMKNFGEFYNNQIEAAGTIILSRTQKLSQEKLEAAAAMLREKNPDAAILTTPWDELDGKTILSAIEKVSLSDELLEKMRREHEIEEAEHEHEHHHHHDEHDEHDHEHDHEHHHHHSGMEEIGHLIGHLPVSEKVRADIRAVYDSIAQAESHVHGVPVTDIHFHEVGTMDAVADVTAVCLLMEELAADQVIASPVHVGGGTVRCAHGVLPVPAPATAYLLRDVPIYGGAIQGELCTPTGAALLRHFVTRFGDMPVMTLESVGYGMGRKDFPRANCLRAMLGETAAESGDVVELACNLDDMTGEGIAFAMERLLAAGALDVYTLPIGMKKSRPGVMLCVLCREEQREDMVHLLLRHTTTLGVRETRHRRYTLSRSQDTVNSPWGPVARKTSQGWGVRRQKPEYEDLARIAREQDLTLDQVRDGLK